MPWGATDWWNYGGLTGSVWLEAAPAIHVARADVVPHLDAVEVEVLISQAAELGGLAPPEADAPAGIPAGMPATLRATIHAASVNPDNLLDPDPRGLVTDLADPLLVVEEEVELPGAGLASGVRLALQFGDADTWSPAVPALYVLRVQLLRTEPSPDPREGRLRDELWTTFGIRHVAVDPAGPSILLNGERSFFRGVGLHAETLTFDADAKLTGGTPGTAA